MTANPDPAGTVLLLGNYRPTIVLARELGAAGFRVVSGLDGCDRGAELSRHVDEVFDHPPVNADRAACLDAIAALVASRPDIACVFPVSEEYVRLFAQERAVLPSHVTLASLAPGLVEKCLDKKTMLTLAVSCGVPVAPFAEVADIDELKTGADKIGFPIVIRPADSTQRLDGQKAVTIMGMADLDYRFRRWPEGQSSLLIQKKANGIRHNFYFAAANGRLKRRLHAVITRTDRTDGSGLAVDGVTVEPDAALTAYTEALIDALDYSGIGCAQYLVDGDSGAVSFLEINPRIAGNHAVPDYCGLDLGLFLFELCKGADVASAPDRTGRAGVRYSWLAGDIDGLKSSWKRGEIDAAGAWRWARALGRTMRASDIDMMLNRRDPLPGIVTLADVIPGIGHLTRLRHRFPEAGFKARAKLPSAPRPVSASLHPRAR